MGVKVDILMAAINNCNHEWKRGHTTCIDPDGWYYDQPTHEVEYVCSKCGKVEWRKI